MAEMAPAQPKRGPGRPFQPGQSGNVAGRPKGSRNRVTRIAQELLENEAEALTRRAIELAMTGDPGCLRLCLDRILPARRNRTVELDLPELVNTIDGSRAIAQIAGAAASAAITPGEAVELAHVIQAFIKVAEVADMERRLQLLEQLQRGDA